MSDLRLVPAICELAPGTLPATVEVDATALEDAELRLLAQAVGDHLPAELHARVLALRARRAQLLAADRGALAVSWGNEPHEARADGPTPDAILGWSQR